MAVFHDEVEIEDFEYDEESETYFYPCPCGDQFEITKVCKVALIESHVGERNLCDRQSKRKLAIVKIWF